MRYGTMLSGTGFPRADAGSDFLQAGRRQVLDKLAHRLRLQPEAGHTLPLGEVVGALGPRWGARPRADAGSCPDRVPLRCLLVDDNDAFLETATALLEREGMTVAGVASSTDEALGQAQALRPGVILVHIGLGDESGFDLARRLIRDGHGGGAAVIMISARSEADYEELIAESPAAGFLPKSELSAQRIGGILGHSTLTAKNVREFQPERGQHGPEVRERLFGLGVRTAISGQAAIGQFSQLSRDGEQPGPLRLRCGRVRAGACRVLEYE